MSRSEHEVLLEDIENVHANLSVALVCLVLWFCEFFHTLPTEASFIWRSDWGLSKMLYFANRMVPLVFLPFMMAALVIRDPSPKQCQGLYGVVFVGNIVTIAFAEAILYLRLYALSGCRRGMRIFLIVNWTAVFIWINVFISLYVARQPWDSAPQTSSVGGCRVVSLGPLPIYIVLVAAGVMYNGIVTMGLSIYFGWKHYWGLTTTPFMRLFFRDGMIYFGGCTAMTILNAIGALSLPEPYAFIFGPVQGLVHSVLATRMVLLVKERARQDMGFSLPSKAETSWRARSQGLSEESTWK
ncbi:hypothetical protein BKA70DRAFT_623291 [Coprinopsis sp. MPI-PUGE-AT-0042]|nr:hypothetical protein BKA70DRAFT_623291 [Coprinopsis sp. MPI-PUGE-AT-0042]